jgi:hypothetical protein
MNMKYMYVCCHCDAVWSGARMVEGAAAAAAAAAAGAVAGAGA